MGIIQKGEAIAHAMKSKMTLAPLKGCMVRHDNDVSTLYVGGAVVGGYYHKSETAVFFKTNRGNRDLINAVKVAM